MLGKTARITRVIQCAIIAARIRENLGVWCDGMTIAEKKEVVRRLLRRGETHAAAQWQQISGV